MDRRIERFLEALKASLKEQEVNWTEEITPEEWLDLFALSKNHHVLPVIYEAVCASPAIRKLDPQLLMSVKRDVIQLVSLQAMKSNELLRLYRFVTDSGVEPLVVKGIICRNLYPKPDYRISSDEDFFIQEEMFGKCNELLLSYGMQHEDPEQDIETAHEVTYQKTGMSFYIELHKSLFPSESTAYGSLNSYFEKAFERKVAVEIDGTYIQTLGYTEHLFYLICHAFKHFLHSGFGIRQVCDIVMMANQHGEEIDWEWIFAQTKKIKAEYFAAALFKIGENYLVFDPKQAHFPESFQEMQVDELPILNDLLDGGVYGASDATRVHSSTITLNAVSAYNKGDKAKVNVWKSIFPDAKSLKGRYPYLEKRAYLLPIAWADRILKYRKEIKVSGENSAAESVKIGGERVELLRKYKIIE